MTDLSTPAPPKKYAPALNNGKHPGGSPRLKLTPEQARIIESMASHGCSMAIVASALEISPSVLVDNKEFANAYKKAFTHLQDRLACAQVAKALEKDDTIMQIWLGKQLLGQSDRADTDQRPISIIIKLSGNQSTAKPLLEGKVLRELELDKPPADSNLT